MLIDKLVLGTAQLGLPDYGITRSEGTLEEEEGQRFLNTAWDCGIRYLDTASVYGKAFSRIRTFHSQTPQRFSIISKLSSNEMTSGDLVRAVQQQICVLKVEHLEAILLHQFPAADSVNQLLGRLTLAKERGLTKKIGVSLYTNQELACALQWPIDLVQMPFNVLDNWSSRGPLLLAAERQGKEVHARSVFLQGLLLKTRKDCPNELQALAVYMKDLTAHLPRGENELLKVCLGYALEQPTIKRVIVGAETVAQLVDIVGAVREYRFSAQLKAAVDAIVVREQHLLDPRNWPKQS